MGEDHPDEGKVLLIAWEKTTLTVIGRDKAIRRPHGVRIACSVAVGNMLGWIRPHPGGSAQPPAPGQSPRRLLAVVWGPVLLGEPRHREGQGQGRGLRGWEQEMGLL